MRWMLSHSSDWRARQIAARHYSRQHPESKCIMPPGRQLVLLSTDERAVWGTSWPFAQYVHRDYADAWLCSLFRNESDARASELIREAIAATRWRFGEPPASGMVTMVDPRKVAGVKRHGKPVYGWCFQKSGFIEVGKTKGGLIMLQLPPAAMPAPMRPVMWRVDHIAALAQVEPTGRVSCRAPGCANAAMAGQDYCVRHLMTF